LGGDRIDAVDAGRANGAGIRNYWDGDRSRLEPALVFFRAFGRAVNAAGLIGLVAGLVLILAGLDDPLLIGPNAAMALMSLFYGGLVHLAVIIPFTAMIKNRIAESNNRELP